LFEICYGWAQTQRQSMSTQEHLSRREFLVSTAALLLATKLDAAEDFVEPPEPIIDIHQHTNYHDRTNEQLIAHQTAMGVTLTVLLPAGSPVDRPSTHQGKSNGLAAKCAGNESVLQLSRSHPNAFRFFANEVPDLPEARRELEKYLKLGAIGIGEQKFGVACDSKELHLVVEVAQEFSVPVLMHFMHNQYNTGIENFHKTLEKFPKVNFIGHAQTWWGNIDKNHDPAVMYPLTKVTPGGITDRLLSDYPNMYGDMSAGSGRNSMMRDEEHARWFLDKHQNKLLYGSDCADAIGRGPGCDGAKIMAAIRRLVPNKTVERRILYENAKRLLKL
jgi:predicted TIM-barrel fold metal-dependent hydrolase